MKKILVVEDDPSLLELEKSILEDLYTVVTAENGKEALKKVKEESPDLIVLDLMMPVMDGLQFCEELKKEKKHENIPIVMVTAKNKREDMEEGYLIGAQAYIFKPFTADDLLKVVELLIHD
ncbi:response regulator [candidate division CSSED10-310 bacterium]|uniref:Response regulator n=1 Tax=candidate division CSSED10-310 bacterium TaxID=2855610 RepID=A0ABV6YV42_UNCC1